MSGAEIYLLFEALMETIIRVGFGVAIGIIWGLRQSTKYKG